MADLLTHVLVAYALATVASWHVAWLTQQWVAVAMIGAVLPDLNRLDLLLAEPTVEVALGVPFRYGAVHTLGGVVLLAAIGALVFASHQRRAFALVFAGALSHLCLDAVKAYADGAAGAWLYPLTWARHPTPSLFVSSEVSVLAMAGLLAVSVGLLDRRRDPT